VRVWYVTIQFHGSNGWLGTTITPKYFMWFHVIFFRLWFPGFWCCILLEIIKESVEIDPHPNNLNKEMASPWVVMEASHSQPDSWRTRPSMFAWEISAVGFNKGLSCPLFSVGPNRTLPFIPIPWLWLANLLVLSAHSLCLHCITITSTEDGGSKFLWNVGIYLQYSTASEPKKSQCKPSLLRKSQISYVI
jgi:hypothetical protein